MDWHTTPASPRMIMIILHHSGHMRRNMGATLAAWGFQLACRHAGTDGERPWHAYTKRI